ncbi:MAG: hypothetical protein WKF91_12960 [Segetibacter sp.]
MQNTGRNQSEKARKEIEKAFGLVQAGGNKKEQAYRLQPINVLKVQYGKYETRRAITNVLNAVLDTYKYASIAELNAILKQYNTLADRGTESSMVFKNDGLLYRLLDDNGQRVGVPVKASDIFGKPTLRYLQARFPQCDLARQKHKIRVKNAIDLSSLKNANQSIQGLCKSLEKDGVMAVIRQNEGKVSSIISVH